MRPARPRVPRSYQARRIFVPKPGVQPRGGVRVVFAEVAFATVRIGAAGMGLSRTSCEWNVPSRGCSPAADGCGLTAGGCSPTFWRCSLPSRRCGLAAGECDLPSRRRGLTSGECSLPSRRCGLPSGGWGGLFWAKGAVFRGKRAFSWVLTLRKGRKGGAPLCQPAIRTPEMPWDSSTWDSSTWDSDPISPPNPQPKKR